jgi:hypothetical protein
MLQQPTEAVADVQAEIDHLGHVLHPDQGRQHQQQHDREHLGGVDRRELSSASRRGLALVLFCFTQLRTPR